MGGARSRGRGGARHGPSSSQEHQRHTLPARALHVRSTFKEEKESQGRGTGACWSCATLHIYRGGREPGCCHSRDGSDDNQRRRPRADAPALGILLALNVFHDSCCNVSHMDVVWAGDKERPLQARPVGAA